MKKKLFVIIFLIIVSKPFVFAQDTIPKQDTIHKNNVIGIHATSLLFFQNLHFKYETNISNKLSFALNVNYMPSRSIPSLFMPVDNDTISYSDDQMSGWGITPELRFYPGSSKAIPRGLYIGAYVRMDDYSYSTSFTYTDSNGESVVFNMDGSRSQLHGGLMIGYQWLIGEQFSIDFYFVGVGLSRRKVKEIYTSDYLLIDYQAWQDEIENSVEDNEEVFVSSGNDYIMAEITKNTLGFRTGVVIGWAF